LKTLINFLLNLAKKLKNVTYTLTRFLKKTKKTILLIIIVSSLTLLFSTIITMWLNNTYNLNIPTIFYKIRFPSFGAVRIIGAEAYGGDLNTNNGGQYLDWGTIYPGTSTNRSFYIKSKSNTPTILNLKIANFTFQNSKGENISASLLAKNPLEITWNYNNQILAPNEEIYVTLTLKAPSNIGFLEFLINSQVQNFSFEITITASPPT